MDAVEPLLKRAVYERLQGGLSADIPGKGMSITVPDRSILVDGSIRSIRVPGGYFSSM